jgi:ABC-type lipoprotein export system ATPase subunit
MVKSHQLVFAYPGQPQMQFPDVRCASGESMLILGQSGKGKTTLLQLLAGLRRPQSGSIKIGGTEITRLSGRALDQFRGKHIGLVFQQSHFIRALTVEENLLLAQKLAGLPADKTKIVQLLSQLGLPQKLQKKPNQLSVGEQQRVAIARAILNQPNMILADEPTSALDDHHCEEVAGLLQNQAREAGAALLIVTHDYRLKKKIPKQIELV